MSGWLTLLLSVFLMMFPGHVESSKSCQKQKNPDKYMLYLISNTITNNSISF